MRRLPVAAFVALAVATVAAFFVTQHLKVTTPLLDGLPGPDPAAINPVNGRSAGPSARRHVKPVDIATIGLVLLLNRADDVDVVHHRPATA